MLPGGVQGRGPSPPPPPSRAFEAGMAPGGKGSGTPECSCFWEACGVLIRDKMMLASKSCVSAFNQGRKSLVLVEVYRGQCFPPTMLLSQRARAAK